MQNRQVPITPNPKHHATSHRPSVDTPRIVVGEDALPRRADKRPVHCISIGETMHMRMRPVGKKYDRNVPVAEMGCGSESVAIHQYAAGHAAMNRVVT